MLKEVIIRIQKSGIDFFTTTSPGFLCYKEKSGK